MPTPALLKHALLAVALLAACSLHAQRTTENVRVSSYLYADLEKVDDASGGLIIRFKNPSTTRKVVAYGWANRKLRKSRVGTTEDQRENVKPRLAEMSENGKVATFRKLPHDFYDVAVIDYVTMTFHEGLSLHHLADDTNQPSPENIQRFNKEIEKTICGSREDGVAAWEGFFEKKRIDRYQYADDQAGILLQQVRVGKALAESGTQLAGNIHSLDVVWIQRTLVEGHGWQVINRQQLYRGEIQDDGFFKQTFVKEFSGIRIGSRVKTLKKVFDLK